MYFRMYSILETKVRDKLCVVIVLTEWLEDEHYYWPGNNYNRCLLKQINHSADWNKYKFEKILRTGIGMYVVYLFYYFIT